jgi:molecular chaperone GrpE
MDHPKKMATPDEGDEARTSDDRLKDLEKQLLEKEDLYLRSLADLDNYRKRMDREIKEVERKTKKALLIELIEVVDNLERAIDSKGKCAVSIKEGIRAIHRQVLGILNRYGVVQLESLGKEFDPRYHEAAGMIESKDFPAGTVGVEMRKAYLMGEDMLRPAHVLVVV